jgi:hypothetical protein
MKLEPAGFLIVLALYMSGILGRFIFPVMNVLCRWLDLPLIPQG